MHDFIELHTKVDGEPILVRPDAILWIYPFKGNTDLTAGGCVLGVLHSGNMIVGESLSEMQEILIKGYLEER